MPWRLCYKIFVPPQYLQPGYKTRSCEDFHDRTRPARAASRACGSRSLGNSGCAPRGRTRAQEKTHSSPGAPARRTNEQTPSGCRKQMLDLHGLRMPLPGALNIQQLALTQAQQRRLEKLALEAGRTPQSMLRYVLRDGFEQCEDDVAAARNAESEMARFGTVPHGRIAREARAVTSRHARAQRRQAA